MTLKTFVTALLPAMALVATAPAAAQSSGALLIWPVDPVLEARQNATALWLENNGTLPKTLQVRVFAWAQKNGSNVYAAQDDVIGSPPILTIAPGQRQLVRLTRTVPPSDEPERSYRVIVDEIPVPQTAEKGAGASVSFRMRYSIPLFSYAQEMPLDLRETIKTEQVKRALQWHVGQDADGRYLEVKNEAKIHARLVDVSFEKENSTSPVAKGLLGYVLPGSTVRWPLPNETQASATLVTTLNGTAVTMIPFAAN